MNFKDHMKNVIHKSKNIWKTGKVQRSSRVTYGVFWNIVLFFVIVGFIGFVFVGGLGAGYFASLVKDEEILDYETMAQDIYNYSETSRMYFANKVYFGEVSSILHRDETTLEKIDPILIDAVIATEDEYFNEHQGVVPKAILRAVLQEATNSANQTGGSTLTQQLIKNQILTNEVSFERKAKEILLALRLERFFEKDEILEAYLNIVPYGRNASGQNIAGIQTAAQGIFGINADEVNLAQAAYLAGLPQSPSAYTPFANGGGLKSEEGMAAGLARMNTVLNRMLDMEYITMDQYNEAKNYDLVADFTEEQDSAFEQYPILTAVIQESAQKVLFDTFIEEDGYTEQDLKAIPSLRGEYEEKARRALEMNGYEIHTTIDKEMYDAFRDVANNFQYYPPDTVTELKDAEGNVVREVHQQAQAAGVMIENSTGRILSFLGSRKFTDDDHTNYARSRRSNGSTMKPILAYGPALEEGHIQPGTPIADVFLQVPDGGGVTEIRNIDRRHHGILPARTNLAKSYNIPAVRTYLPLIDMNPVEKYLRKMGISSIGDDEYAHASLAIGGTRNGITLEETANAFSTIANAGEFLDAYIIEKITTTDGETVFEHEQTSEVVFSPQTSYLLTDMMRDVLSDGTATPIRPLLKYKSVDWAGKTGTSSNAYDINFFGSNPNVTLGTWMGYEFHDTLDRPGSDGLYYSHRNLRLWAELVNAASDINPELVAPSHAFQQPEGIVSRSYCSISGLLPSELCEKAGLVKTDLFNAKFVPTEVDNSLITGKHVLVDGKSAPAGPNTPAEFVSGDGLMFNPEFLKEKGYDKLSDITTIIPQNGDRSKWEKIAFPGTSMTSNLEDDGKAPPAPTGIKSSSSKLTWNAVKNNDVVGYRIYKAAAPDGNFSKAGSTNATSTEFAINNDYAIYQIKAVDYFGKESTESTVVTVGKAPEPEPEDPKDDEKDKDKGKDNGKGKGNGKGNGKEKGKDKDKDKDKEKDKEKDNPSDKDGND